MTTLNKVLKFLCFSDRAGSLSITNIALIVLITKIAISPFDWPAAGGLFIAVLNYMHKRNESAKAVSEASAPSAEITEIKAKADTAMEAVTRVVEVQNKITADMVRINATSDSLAKTAEETQKLLSTANLALGFRARK